MSRVLFLLLAMVLAGLGQPTLAAPLPDRLRQDDPGPTRESPLRDPRLNPYAPRQP